MQTIAAIVPMSVGYLRAHASRLIQEHYDEVCAVKDLQALDPMWDEYEAVERRGKAFVLGAQVGDELVGYSLTFVGPHIHYANTIAAHNDVVFLTKEHRRSGLGLELIQATERLARDKGAVYITWHAKPGSALERMMPRMGYRAHETVFLKRL